MASGIFAERFVDGPEFTILVVADQMEARTGVLYVLEVNANCGLSSDEETSVGQIWRLARVPIHQLIASILEDALVWFQSTGQPQGHGQ